LIGNSIVGAGLVLGPLLFPTDSPGIISTYDLTFSVNGDTPLFPRYYFFPVGSSKSFPSVFLAEVFSIPFFLYSTRAL
jgi:hypothetical protein